MFSEADENLANAEAIGWAELMFSKTLAIKVQQLYIKRSDG